MDHHGGGADVGVVLVVVVHFGGGCQGVKMFLLYGGNPGGDWRLGEPKDNLT